MRARASPRRSPRERSHRPRARSRVALALTSPMMRTASPGPGTAGGRTIASGKPEHAPELAHFVLEEHAQRLDQREIHLFGQAADVVVRFDLVAGLALRRLRFDDVGIERALHEVLDAGNLRRFFFEDGDELVADRDALLLRDRRLPRACARKRSRASTAITLRCSTSRNAASTSAGLVLAQQAVIDEDAGQLLADRARDQRRRDGRIDAAGERADHLVAADIARESRCDRRLDERVHLPVAARCRRSGAGSSREDRARIRCARPPDGTARRRSSSSRSPIAATWQRAVEASAR